ncbi:MAG TPA: tripartite tricarboxylate transporter substrate-binding protein [Roseomonas sp.]
MTKLLLPRRTAAMAAVGLLAAPALRAQSGRPIRLVIPFSAGGNTDVVARVIAPRASEILGQTVVVENRPSASAVVGTEVVARARPDGATLLMIDTTLPVLPTLHPQLPFDIFRDLTPLGAAVTAPTTLVVGSAMPARTLQEVVDRARAAPGRLTYATGSLGGTAHLAGLLMQEAASIRLTHVPYAGAGQALNDLVGGRLDITFSALSAVQGLMDTGLLRAIATTGAERLPIAPDLPTFVEGGLPQVVVVAHWCFYAPGGTPAAIADPLSDALMRATRDAATKADLERRGYVVVATSAAEHARILREEYEKWGGVMRRSGEAPEGGRR